MNSDTPEWRIAERLTGPTLELRKLAVVDAPDFLNALGSPEEAAEVTAHLRYGPPADAADAAAEIAALLAGPAQFPYGQWLRGTGEFVGTTSFYEIDPALRALAIGHTWISRRHWRSRMNTESKLIMLGHAFDDLAAERVVWHTDILNLRSQAAIERLGATREGVLRHHRIRRDGSWRDTVQYSLLSAEWPAVRSRLQDRLDRSAGAEPPLDRKQP